MSFWEPQMDRLCLGWSALIRTSDGWTVLCGYGNSVEGTLVGENSLEQATTETLGEFVVEAEYEENITSWLSVEENKLFNESIEENIVSRVTTDRYFNILAEDIKESHDVRNTSVKSLLWTHNEQKHGYINNIERETDCRHCWTFHSHWFWLFKIFETIENKIFGPSDAKLPPSWRWFADCLQESCRSIWWDSNTTQPF